jgi:tetratricopeptide (TPR) repeat protein
MTNTVTIRGADGGDALYELDRVLTSLLQLLQANRIDEAADLYARVRDDVSYPLISRAQSDKNTFRRLANLFFRARDYARAAYCCEHLDEPAKAAALYEQAGDFAASAQMFAAAGDVARAAAMFERAGNHVEAARMYLTIATPDSLLRAGSCFERAGRAFDAAQSYERAGRPEQALALYQSIDDDSPDKRVAAKLARALIDRFAAANPAPPGATTTPWGMRGPDPAADFEPRGTDPFLRRPVASGFGLAAAGLGGTGPEGADPRLLDPFTRTATSPGLAAPGIAAHTPAWPPASTAAAAFPADERTADAFGVPASLPTTTPSSTGGSAVLAPPVPLAPVPVATAAIVPGATPWTTAPAPVAGASLGTNSHEAAAADPFARVATSPSLPAPPFSNVGAPALSDPGGVAVTPAGTSVTLMEGFDALKALPLFSPLSLGELKSVYHLCSIVPLLPGEPLIGAGAPAPALWIVLDGELLVRAPTGTEVARVGRGDHVGEMGLFDDAPASVDVIVARAGRALRLQRSGLRDMVANNDSLAARIYRVLFLMLRDRLRSTTQRVI